MSLIDWIVLVITLVIITTYGIIKGKNQKDAHSYLLADRQFPWYIVLLGIMSTQASAITFLSAPGQAYVDGMRFVQYYFGLPLAMIAICAIFIPIFRRLKVYTAYSYLEERFDKKTRILTAFLFLLSRGVSTGISIYAPAIILSTILGIHIYIANIITGGILIIYTCWGGANAVAHTQKLQFTIIMGSMVLAACILFNQLPHDIQFNDVVKIAGLSGKMNIIETSFNWKDKYNIWSGIIGGFFLALSYFGTDQSQVGRYITAKDDTSSKMGLLMNGAMKIPMQFFILSIGVILFVYYSINAAPVSFNDTAYSKYKQIHKAEAYQYENTWNELSNKLKENTKSLAYSNDFEVKASRIALIKAMDSSRIKLHKSMHASGISADVNDTNYIFLYFVKHNLPVGLVGLIFAVIILASWGSISAALHSLASSSLIDFHLILKASKQDVLLNNVSVSRLHTLGWGIFCIAIAMFAANLGSLIEAVNVLGSLFYGTILGIFLVAFFMKHIKADAVFIAAIITEVAICYIYILDIVSFLWLNVFGALLVLLFSQLYHWILKLKRV